MRTIHIYKVGQEAWISPAQLLQAVKSNEVVTMLAHAAQIDIPHALGVAAEYIRHIMLATIRAALAGTLWCLAIAGIAKWPIVATRMLPEVQGAIYLGGLAGVLICGSIIAYNIYQLHWFHNRSFKFPIRAGHELPPPSIALRPSPRQMPGIKWSVATLIAMIALNSIVVATPMAPAIVWDKQGTYLAEQTTYVMPFTEWEQRPRYPTGSSVVYFAVTEEESYVWVIFVDYYVYRPDITAEYDEWDSWLDSILYAIVNNVRNNTAIQMDPNLDPDARLAETIRLFEDTVFLKELEQVLIQYFNERYDGLYLRGVTASVRRMTIPQYQDALRQ